MVIIWSMFLLGYKVKEYQSSNCHVHDIIYTVYCPSTVDRPQDVIVFETFTVTNSDVVKI